MLLYFAVFISLIATASAFAPELRPSMYIDSYVVGGEDAEPGEFPWQLSQERLGSTWSHSCGASLLSNRYGLSAAHCVDGASPSILRVKAGLYKRSDTSSAQTVYISSYKMHERYELDSGSFSNDIAILVFTSSIHYTDDIQPALIPTNNNNLFTDETCVISGWGRTSSSNALPDTLQKADMVVMSNTGCQTAMRGVIGAKIWDGHICIIDPKFQSGSCNGDSGGPLNCKYGLRGVAVVGVTSWGISSFGACQQNYPSVYTRVGYYADWIETNTP